MRGTQPGTQPSYPRRLVFGVLKVGLAVGLYDPYGFLTGGLEVGLAFWECGLLELRALGLVEVRARGLALVERSSLALASCCR